MDERRQLPRWEIKKEAKVWMPQTEGFSQCIVEDMNLKGMCVSFVQRLPEEDPFRMSFSIGDIFAFIKVEAQISWTKKEEDKHVYGLSFCKISDEDKDKMYQYINKNCYEQFRAKWWA